MNHITLIGRFVADPAISATTTGKQLCRFVLAVNRPHTKDTADFFDMIAWEHTGLFISKHFKKGQRVAVSGYLINHKYTDKEGNKRKLAEVIVKDVYFADAVPAKTLPDNSEVTYGGDYGISDEEFMEMTIPI